MIAESLRNEGLRLLDNKGAILDVARRVSSALEASSINAAIIGGVSVVLHGHVRTTVDVDVFVAGPLEATSSCLQADGFKFDPSAREFVLDGVPVHLVTPEQTGLTPDTFTTIEGIRTVSLADLLSLKLHSGSKSVLRSQDLADVIGLMRVHKLTGAFTPRVAKLVRKQFRQLLRAIERGQ